MLKKESLVSKKREIKEANVKKQPIYLLIYKEMTLLTNISNTQNLPSCVKDLFPKEISNGFPHIRRTEHHIDLIPRELLPNMSTYRSNP